MSALKWYEDPKVFREKRKRLGLTQQKLAKKSGVDRTIIANIEAGRRKLTGDVADLLWDVLDRMSLLRRRELLTPEQRASERATLKFSKVQYEQYSRKLIEQLKNRDAELEQTYKLHLAKRQGQLDALERASSLNDPIVKELIESFRREIAGLRQQIADLQKHEPPNLTPLSILVYSKLLPGKPLTDRDHEAIVEADKTVTKLKEEVGDA